MAGWSLFDDGVLVEDKGVVVGVSYEKTRCRFGVFLVEFLREICPLNSSLSFPPMLGDGQHVDLYKLFMVVKGKGGYDVVCDGKLWDVVGEESGLGVSVGSSVKLVYSKYLSALDAWMKKVADSKVPFECSLVDDKDKFGRHLMELQDEVKGLLSDCAAEDEVAGEEFKSGFDDEYKDGRMLCGTNGMKGLNLESNGDEEVRNGACPDSEMLDHGMNESLLGNLCEGNDAIGVLDEFDGEKMSVEPTVDVSDAGNSSMPGLLSEGEKCDDDDDDLVVLDPSAGDTESTGGCKRKRESMLDLLSWITRVARNPCDPVVGSIPEKPKWKSCSNQEIWKQVLLFREFVFLKRDFEATSENRSWQMQKMHPSLYDDHLGATYNLRERSKCDKKTLFRKPISAVRSSSESSVGTGVDLNRTPSPHTEDRAEKQFLHSSDVHSGLDGCVRVIIPLGPNHQAEVPEWTGMTSESDSKWLGTQIWPTDKVNSRFLIERDPIGKGRQDSCGCSVPGSVECIRFHISEKRSKVKLELGLAFFQWNFDKSGEDVAKLWKDKDEKKFKEVVQSNPPSSDSYFWDHIFPSFPHKSREDLVSYYFNVFLLQRRGYQNRHTPDNVDSDDDGSECGPLRNVFGQKSRSSILLTPKKPQTKGR